jgi:hypothetical protein
MSWNAKIISVPGYSFISSESGLLFSRSSIQTCDHEVKIPILLKKTLHRSILWVSCPLFSSPDPKGHVSYCHHLASVVVVRRKLFQKSSPLILKVLDQWKPNLVWIITRVSSFKIVSGDSVHQPTWPLLLKIEHMVKLQVLGNNSKTVNNIKNLTWGKNDQHIKIYLPCKYEVNLIIFQKLFRDRW